VLEAWRDRRTVVRMHGPRHCHRWEQERAKHVHRRSGNFDPPVDD